MGTMNRIFMNLYWVTYWKHLWYK